MSSGPSCPPLPTPRLPAATTTSALYFRLSGGSNDGNGAALAVCLLLGAAARARPPRRARSAAARGRGRASRRRRRRARARARRRGRGSAARSRRRRRAPRARSGRSRPRSGPGASCGRRCASRSRDRARLPLGDDAQALASLRCVAFRDRARPRASSRSRRSAATAAPLADADGGDDGDAGAAAAGRSRPPRARRTPTAAARVAGRRAVRRGARRVLGRVARARRRDRVAALRRARALGARGVRRARGGAPPRGLCRRRPLAAALTPRARRGRSRPGARGRARRSCGRLTRGPPARTERLERPTARPRARAPRAVRGVARSRRWAPPRLRAPAPSAPPLLYRQRAGTRARRRARVHIFSGGAPPPLASRAAYASETRRDAVGDELAVLLESSLWGGAGGAGGSAGGRGGGKTGASGARHRAGSRAPRTWSASWRCRTRRGSRAPRARRRRDCVRAAGGPALAARGRASAAARAAAERRVRIEGGRAGDGEARPRAREGRRARARGGSSVISSSATESTRPEPLTRRFVESFDVFQMMYSSESSSRKTRADGLPLRPYLRAAAACENRGGRERERESGEDAARGAALDRREALAPHLGLELAQERRRRLGDAARLALLALRRRLAGALACASASARARAGAEDEKTSGRAAGGARAAGAHRALRAPSIILEEAAAPRPPCRRRRYRCRCTLGEALNPPPPPPRILSYYRLGNRARVRHHVPTAAWRSAGATEGRRRPTRHCDAADGTHTKADVAGTPSIRIWARQLARGSCRGARGRSTRHPASTG